MNTLLSTQAGMVACTQHTDWHKHFTQHTGWHDHLALSTWAGMNTLLSTQANINTCTLRKDWHGKIHLKSSLLAIRSVFGLPLNRSTPDLLGQNNHF